jgi:tryptophan synthase alpha chain
MNRIDQTFKNLSRLKQKAFIAYITAGDPDLETTFKAIPILEKAGVDIIELGIPFSDPIGDGPVNQLAAERALKKGGSLQSILQGLEKFRRVSNIPIVLFSYMNPIYAMGYEVFAKKAANAGVDGVLTVDGPFDMCKPLRDHLSQKGIHSIYLVAPTTNTARIKQITKYSNGFTYAVSSLGSQEFVKNFLKI